MSFYDRYDLWKGTEPSLGELYKSQWYISEGGIGKVEVSCCSIHLVQQILKYYEKEQHDTSRHTKEYTYLHF